MNYFKSLFVFAIAIVSMFSLTACSTTEITGSWKSPEFAQPVDSMLVIARVEGESMRRMAEDRFATALQDWGVNAVASYRVFPDSPELEKETVEQKARELGLQGFLILRVLEKEKEETQTMYGSPYYSGYGYPYGDPFFDRYPHYRSWYPYYGYGYNYPYAQTITREYTILRLETNLYRQREEGGLVWAARMKTEILNGLEKIIDDVAKETAAEMAKANVI